MSTDSRLAGWTESWDNNDIGFHKTAVHKMLEKHIKLLIPENTEQKILFPLCGKAVDMKWLADQGHTVIGIDGVRKALESFYTEQKLEWNEKEATNMGPGCLLLESSVGKIKLYCGDMMIFNESVEGQFDLIWDRGSLVALNREDISCYVQIIKNVLKQKGKLFLEVMEYDLADFEGASSPPPPYAMFEAEIKKLFEPDCTVKYIDKDEIINFFGKKCNTIYYLIVKN